MILVLVVVLFLLGSRDFNQIQNTFKVECDFKPTTVRLHCRISVCVWERTATKIEISLKIKETHTLECERGSLAGWNLRNWSSSSTKRAGSQRGRRLYGCGIFYSKTRWQRWRCVCGGQDGRQIVEAGSALFGFSSRGVLLVTAGCSLSRDPTGIIGSPSLRDEPPGYVATEEQNRVNNKSDSFLVYCDIRQISILKSLQF